MNEAKVGFLYKAAAVVSKNRNDDVYKTLKSYYLLRCSETTKGYGLPQQQFSSKLRCSHCFIEWNNDFESKVTPLKLSKKQKRRIRDRVTKRRRKQEGMIIHGNKFEQTCNFCKHTTTTYLSKPDKMVSKNQIDENKLIHTRKKDEKAIKTTKLIQKNVTNVYCKSKEAFSMKNNKNTLQNVIKEPQKIIKNNKKRKDKFAGLCQKAVLSAAKLKSDKDKQNKINLFLKPSQ